MDIRKVVPLLTLPIKLQSAPLSLFKTFWLRNTVLNLHSIFSFLSNQTVLTKTKKEMAVAARGKATELQIPKKWRDRSECSPERTIVWTEPKANKTCEKRSVPVVYYLSRNGQLEHPHFIEVPLSSPEGLYLRGKIQTQLYKNYSSFF